MADALPRYQVGDQCYDGAQAAGQAWLARQEPYYINVDFGFGDGIESAAFMPVSIDVPDNGDPAQVLYEVTGLASGSTDSRALAWYPVPCELDGAQAARMADLFELWPQLLVLLVGVWLARRLTDLFTRDTRDA
jgi:hypothetical protein